MTIQEGRRSGGLVQPRLLWLEASHGGCSDESRQDRGVDVCARKHDCGATLTHQQYLTGDCGHARRPRTFGNEPLVAKYAANGITDLSFTDHRHSVDR